MNQELKRAVEKNDLNCVKSLVKKEQKIVDEVDESGNHISFFAAKMGRFEIVDYLMSYTRVSQDIWDKDHNSILHYGAISDNIELFTYLIERIDMDPLEVNLLLETPLDCAIKYGSEKIISYYKNTLKIEKNQLYKNPIVTGTYPDPSIVRVKEDYYMVHSSFIFFPCIPILHSKDLIHWQTIGHAVTDSSYINMKDLGNGRGFWAPDISYNNGKFYICATYRLNDEDPILRRQMVVHSKEPEGPYSVPTFIDEDGIDPSIFTDDDGRRYMLLNRGARIFEISDDGSEQLSEAKMLWYGTNKHAPEAPHLLEKDGYYYCFVSEGGTGRNHQISVARSKTLMGSYEACPNNPLLIQRDGKHPIQRSGHGKLVETQNGEWYIVYLCGRMIDQKYSILGRETALDRVTWTKDKWPMINQAKGPSGVAKKPNLKKHKHTNKPRLSFFNKTLDPTWAFVRYKQQKYLSIGTNGVLSMVPGAYDLCHNYARNIMVKRQNAFVCTTSVKIILDETCLPDECGLTCYYDTNTYLKYYITYKDKRYHLVVVEHIGDREVKSLVKVLDEGRLRLKCIELIIDTHYLSRRFKYVIDNEDSGVIGTLDVVDYLCDEGLKLGKRFTGAMIGIYAIDYEGTNNKTAFFSDFKIEGENHEQDLE